jgi:hypothetical protein
MKPQSFATVKGCEKGHRTTRKAAFLSRMESLGAMGSVPRAGRASHDPKAGNGRPPIDLERRLCMSCIGKH